MLGELNRRPGLSLRPERIKLMNGTQVELDGYDPHQRVLCEIYAHIGPLKGSQPDKVASDILKMVVVEKELGTPCRKIYCFADETASQKLSGDSWLARAAEQLGVERVVIDLPKDIRDLIVSAQHRQTMVNK
jgi:hypothetical protein